MTRPKQQRPQSAGFTSRSQRNSASAQAAAPADPVRSYSPPALYSACAQVSIPKPRPKESEAQCTAPRQRSQSTPQKPALGVRPRSKSTARPKAPNRHNSATKSAPEVQKPALGVRSRSKSTARPKAPNRHNSAQKLESAATPKLKSARARSAAPRRPKVAAAAAEEAEWVPPKPKPQTEFRAEIELRMEKRREQLEAVSSSEQQMKLHMDQLQADLDRMTDLDRTELHCGPDSAPPSPRSDDSSDEGNTLLVIEDDDEQTQHAVSRIPLSPARQARNNMRDAEFQRMKESEVSFPFACHYSHSWFLQLVQCNNPHREHSFI